MKVKTSIGHKTYHIFAICRFKSLSSWSRLTGSMVGINARLVEDWRPDTLDVVVFYLNRSDVICRKLRRAAWDWINLSRVILRKFYNRHLETEDSNDERRLVYAGMRATYPSWPDDDQVRVQLWRKFCQNVTAVAPTSVLDRKIGYIHSSQEESHVKIRSQKKSSMKKLIR